MRMTSVAASAAPQSGYQSELFRGFSSIGNKVSSRCSCLVGSIDANVISCQLTDRLKEGGLGGGFENLLSGVKNLLPSRKELIVSRIVSNIVSPTNEVSEVDDYLQFDPKLSKNAKIPRHKVAYQEAIVFVIGGGNYIEYQNLQEIASVRTRRHFIPDYMCLF